MQERISLLTYCTAQCPAAKCGLTARVTFARRRTLLAPTVICNRTMTEKGKKGECGY